MRVPPDLAAPSGRPLLAHRTDNPNRYCLWTGGVGNDGTGGGPVSPTPRRATAGRPTPERLEQAGVSWKIYQDVGTGLDAERSWGWGSEAHIGNYGDNSPLFRHTPGRRPH